MKKPSNPFGPEVSFHRIFAEPEFGFDIKGAIFLSNAIASTKCLPQKAEGWFYKSPAKWTKETGLTRDEQKMYRRQLIQLGILEMNNTGAKPYLKLNMEKVLSHFSI